MKSAIILVSLFMFSFGLVNKNAGSLNPDFALKGIWHVYISYPRIQENWLAPVQDSLVLVRKVEDKYNFGNRIEFHDNGDFIDAYSAPCGNDDNKHHTAGKWTWDKNEELLITTIPVYKNFRLKGYKHKILRLTADTLVLQKVD